jgi:NAD+ synthase (glutamine-hydrolysing)
MNITLHQTHHEIADFDRIFSYLDKEIDLKTKGLHLLPELFLTGYPLQDLCIQKSFIDSYQLMLKKIEKWSKKLGKGTKVLAGGLEYSLDKNGIPLNIKNVVFEISNEGMTSIYTKQLLPNYDIFDEQKYFTAGNESQIYLFEDKKVGILVCEDMWSSSFHDKDPVESLSKDSKNGLDLIVNLSASPFVLGKQNKRITRAHEISNKFKCPFVYLNKVGAEDEIIFDGASFICDGSKIHEQAKRFESDKLQLKFNKENFKYKKNLASKKANTWEDLFSSKITKVDDKTGLTPWTDEECTVVQQALMFGFQEYARKSKFNNFTVALSGGIDSALVLTLMRLSLKPGQYLEAIYMPSIYSSPVSWELSNKLCKNLGIPLSTLPIKFLHSTTKNLFGQTFKQPFEGLTDENIQSRLRGTLLYTRSNQINSMVVNTSNKSELAVGYSTQYGDSVGAISMLGDLFKSEVYRLADFINATNENIIPHEIISRPPTAELRPDQKDSDSLPPYEILDAILDGVLSYRYSSNDLCKAGFSKEDVEKVLSLYKRSEYKRYQFCPILKIASKSFGFGYRVPINKATNFYNIT